MDNNTLIIVLALATLGIGLAVGIYQFMKVRKADNENRKSTFNQNHGELR